MIEAYIGNKRFGDQILADFITLTDLSPQLSTSRINLEYITRIRDDIAQGGVGLADDEIKALSTQASREYSRLVNRWDHDATQWKGIGGVTEEVDPRVFEAVVKAMLPGLDWSAGISKKVINIFSELAFEILKRRLHSRVSPKTIASSGTSPSLSLQRNKKQYLRRPASIIGAFSWPQSAVLSIHGCSRSSVLQCHKQW